MMRSQKLLIRLLPYFTCVSVLICPNAHDLLTESENVSVKICSNIAQIHSHLVSRKPFLIIICHDPHDRLTKVNYVKLEFVKNMAQYHSSGQ